LKKYKKKVQYENKFYNFPLEGILGFQRKDAGTYKGGEIWE